jgi:hypothetical protein
MFEHIITSGLRACTKEGDEELRALACRRGVAVGDPNVPGMHSVREDSMYFKYPDIYFVESQDWMCMSLFRVVEL